MDAKTDTKPNLQDLRTHLDNLQKHDKLTRVTIPINKDTELMPLVRWQFRGLRQDQRKGFLFENVTNAKGQHLNGSVAVSIYAGSPEIYAIGMNCEVKDIRKRWQAAQAAPLKPKVVDYGTVQDEVHMGENLWSTAAWRNSRFRIRRPASTSAPTPPRPTGSPRTTS